MGSLSIWHWILVLCIIILIFGTKKLKHLGHDLGEAIKGFRNAVVEDKPQNLPSNDKTDPKK